MCPGQFPLDALLRWREHEIPAIPCPKCAQVHEISLLVTGFTVPGQTLGAKLEEMRDLLHGQPDRIEGHAAEAAETVRKVLRVVGAEYMDCPRLFTLAPVRPTRTGSASFSRQDYRLTLWCEHPGYWHPWDPATYELHLSEEGFTQVAPYVKLIFRTLQIVVPLAGSIADASLSTYQLERAQTHLEMMSTLVGDLPSKLMQDPEQTGRTEAIGHLTNAEGQALHAIRTLLFEHDRSFGGLRRVQDPAGDVLWVCKDHYQEYDPGLPTIPQD
jgi:hypothetical protein